MRQVRFDQAVTLVTPLLAMQGAPAREIQELARHGDLTMTQRYLHLSPAALADAIRLLDPPGRNKVWRRGEDGVGAERSADPISPPSPAEWVCVGWPTIARSGFRRAKVGGEAGIRTLGTGLSPYNGLANRRFRPLSHLTADFQLYVTQTSARKQSRGDALRRFFGTRVAFLRVSPREVGGGGLLFLGKGPTCLGTGP